ncbi:extracellular solute-binding protein [Streptomyces sp. MP131-18]|uniref:ABC transporter substrate-binding protein n=1 Tax=Streptomyces sp. MP131-18 TaxID=1857892 RepID=UPI00097C9203|nr:extracellular solute-binding protein [Streptomyces sp. MP131-18]ONK10746.1 glycerol-3-phosphate transporter periplasmic binding protein [Streptomyces sp. MP131-18]
MTPIAYRRTRRCLATAAVLAVTVTACSSDDDGGGDDGRVQLHINGQPPSTDTRELRVFNAEIEAFEATHPDIDIVPHEGFMEPETFNTRVAGGDLEDVFYVYFTDPAQIIEQGYAADITDYLADVPHLDQVRPELQEVFQDAEGRQYGVPTANYSMGLLYNRDLFEQAGLDPNAPPTSWEEVREASAAIAELGGGVTGYGECAIENTGGWHLTSEIYSTGGAVAEPDGDSWRAAFNTDATRTLLANLQAMRWEDDSMGSDQMRSCEDLMVAMGAGQLGMYVAAPDNLPTLVRQYDGTYENLGLAPIPEGQGTLIGGEGYMINAGASPEQIEAALTWLQWRFVNPDEIERRIEESLADDLPVGLPMPPTPDIWVEGEIRDNVEALKQEHANVPVENVQPFMDSAATIPGRIEPPRAQEVYAILDNVMQGVLTDGDADIDALLDDAEDQVNRIYGS